MATTVRDAASTREDPQKNGEYLSKMTPLTLCRLERRLVPATHSPPKQRRPKHNHAQPPPSPFCSIDLTTLHCKRSAALATARILLKSQVSIIAPFAPWHVLTRSQPTRRTQRSCANKAPLCHQPTSLNEVQGKMIYPRLPFRMMKPNKNKKKLTYPFQPSSSEVALSRRLAGSGDPYANSDLHNLTPHRGARLNCNRSLTVACIEWLSPAKSCLPCVGDAAHFTYTRSSSLSQDRRGSLLLVTSRWQQACSKIHLLP